MATIGVLALQGDFLEHASALKRIGAEAREVRTAEQLRALDGLIIPGGESTTFCRLMEDYHLYEPLRTVVQSGTPVWGTCAGMIVLARNATDLKYRTLEVMDIAVDRNGYGRQVDSFEADLDVPALGDSPFHAIFIRAPVVTGIGEGVEVLATVKHPATGAQTPAAVRQRVLMATSFHPELTPDARFHEYFVDIARRHRRPSAAK